MPKCRFDNWARPLKRVSVYWFIKARLYSTRLIKYCYYNNLMRLLHWQDSNPPTRWHLCWQSRSSDLSVSLKLWSDQWLSAKVAFVIRQNVMRQKVADPFGSFWQNGSIFGLWCFLVTWSSSTVVTLARKVKIQSLHQFAPKFLKTFMIHLDQSRADLLIKFLLQSVNLHLFKYYKVSPFRSVRNE